jgi:DNA-binding transcriptional ArsR family regulator
MPRSTWFFVTSHAVLLIEVSRTPDATVRELAARAGLTERQTHRVLNDLADEGFIVRERVGRRNRYSVNGKVPMRHPAVKDHRIGDLLEVLSS